MKTIAFAALVASVLADAEDPHGQPATVQDDLEAVLHKFWDITQNVLYWKLDSADVEFEAYNFGSNPYGPIDTDLAQVSAEADAEMDASIVEEYERVIREAWNRTEHELKIKLMSADLEFWYDWRDQSHLSPDDPSPMWA